MSLLLSQLGAPPPPAVVQVRPLVVSSSLPPPRPGRAIVVRPPVSTTPAGFTPADVTGLALWLDAPALALSGGSPVISWTDRSGNARTPTQASGPAQPTITTAAINGLDVVTFGGAQALTFASSIPTTSGFTAFAVVKPSTVANEYAFFNGNGNGYALGTSGPGTNRELLLRGQADVVGGPYTLGLPALWSATGSGAGTELYVEGGVDALSGSGPISASGGLVVGAWETGAASFWFGDIGEIVAYDRVLSVDERAAVTRYLSDRWGLSEQPERPPKTVTAAAAATARTLAGQASTSRILRAPAAGSAVAGDLASSSTFTVTADAVRGAVADQAITSTFGLAADAVRGVAADLTLTSTFAVTAAADVIPALAPRPPYVVDAPPASSWGRPARTILLRAPLAGAAAAGDVSMASTISITADVTRGAIADLTATSTFAVAVAATVDHPSDAAIASTFALAVDGFVGAAPVVAPVVRVVTGVALATGRALWIRPALVLVRHAGPGLVPVDTALPFGFGLATSATLGRPGDTTLSEAFTVTTTAVVGRAGAVAVGAVFTVLADATVSNGAVKAPDITGGRPGGPTATTGTTAITSATGGRPATSTAGPGTTTTSGATAGHPAAATASAGTSTSGQATAGRRPASTAAAATISSTTAVAGRPAGPTIAPATDPPAPTMTGG